MKQLVLRIRPLAKIDCVGDVTGALHTWQQSDYQMVMADSIHLMPAV
ncbi:hypothetical protein [Pseudomonas sp. LB3P14]